ncbi:hypothetical protein JXA02_11415 [candidate division KSB1 bacterium]|nr:hypothetical protein [candidate division KSB1 bacterium]RQW02456.1 MAG: hypothetical protein EH222_13640 [candidate division KSB1 bacterium]
MMKTALLFVCLSFALVSIAAADVKYVSTTSWKLEGAVGTMVKLFGGGKPVKTADYYTDDVKRSDTFDNKERLETSQLVDLNQELFITIDHKKKEYSQMTFDEWKEMMKSTMAQLKGEEQGEAPEEKEEPQAEVKWDVKVDVQETGEKETIAGKNAEKVILTLDLDAEATETEVAEGEEPESVKGGIIVTSSQWLYKGEDAAQKEMNDFNMRLAAKLGFAPGEAQDMMEQVMGQNPQLGEAIEAMQKEADKLQGMAMRVETLYQSKIDPETVKKMEEAKAKEKEEETTEIPTSVGGLIGGLGKKMMKKQMEKKDQGVKERSALMNSKTEVLEFDTSSLSASLFEVPSGFKLVERKGEE